MTGSVARLLVDLEDVVGSAHVLRGDLTDGCRRDWTGRYSGTTPAVIRPADTAEVAAVLALCSATGMAVVPQGGNTGLVGGGVPVDGEVVLSLRRLDSISPVELIQGQLTAGAGATLRGVQMEARRANRSYGVDLASRGSATVGGMVATNAGGMHVLRFGDTRRQLLGIEAVLADGTVIRHLDGLSKDNTGYDLASLICGSEGTLAVVTAARLGLAPQRDERAVAMLGLDSVEQALAVGAEVRSQHPDLEAAEIILEDALVLVCEDQGIPPPFPERSTVYLLLECAGERDPTDGLARTMGRIGIQRVAMAHDRPRREALWRYREAVTEAVNHLGAPHKLDVTLPLEQLGRFVEEVRDCVWDVAPAAGCWLFGHLLDGNIHVNVTGLGPSEDEIDGAVLSLVSAYGGSISAEHGIGRARRRWLHLSRSAEEIRTFRAIKSALDPNGILNPNVLIPARSLSSPGPLSTSRDGRS